MALSASFSHPCTVTLTCQNRTVGPLEATNLPLELLQVRASSPQLGHPLTRHRQSHCLQDGTPVGSAVTVLAAEVRENVKLRRAHWCARHKHARSAKADASAHPQVVWCRHNLWLVCPCWPVQACWPHRQRGCAEFAWCVSNSEAPARHGLTMCAAGAQNVDDSARVQLIQFASQLAMHVAAIRPAFLKAQDIPAAVVDAERASSLAQVPPAVVARR